MAKSKCKNWSKRTWLNTEPTLTAFISWEVEKEEGEEKFPLSWGGVKIADCAKIVILDFPLGNVNANRKSLKKLDKLIDQLNQFRDVIVKEFDT